MALVKKIVSFSSLMMIGCSVESYSLADSEYDYYFISWEVNTRYRYDVEDLMRSKQKAGQLSEDQASEVLEWIEIGTPDDRCRISELDSRFALFNRTEELVVIADRFCLCSASDLKCTTMDQQVRGSVRSWIK